MFSLKKFTQLRFQLLIFLVKCSGLKGTCFHSWYYLVEQGNRFHGYVIEENQVMNLAECTYNCFKTRPSCKSFNFESRGEFLHNKPRRCQLNNATKSSYPLGMVEEEAFDYWEIQTVLVDPKENTSTPVTPSLTTQSETSSSMTQPVTTLSSMTQSVTPLSSMTQPVTPSSSMAQPVTPLSSMTQLPVTLSSSMTQSVTSSSFMTQPVTPSFFLTRPVTPLSSMTQPVTPSSSMTQPVTPSSFMTRPVTPSSSMTQSVTTSPTSQQSSATSCADLYNSGVRQDGKYNVDPDGQGSFQVLCDMTSDGGGWTIFQKRLDGSVDFNRYWADYKDGFGEFSGEFWLGLNKVHRLTSTEMNTLKIDLKSFASENKHASYSPFEVGDQSSNFILTAKNYVGDSGDSLNRHDGMMFTTRDKDNDRSGWQNCAIAFKGGWWFDDGLSSNLNGVYHNGQYSPGEGDRDGVVWETWKGLQESLKVTVMRIRPSNF